MLKYNKDTFKVNESLRVKGARTLKNTKQLLGKSLSQPLHDEMQRRLDIGKRKLSHCVDTLHELRHIDEVNELRYELRWQYKRLDKWKRVLKRIQYA